MSIHWRTLPGEAKVEAIKAVWQKGFSASRIASHFEGVSRNAIIGVYNRYPDKMLDAPLQGNRAASPRQRHGRMISLKPRSTKPLKPTLAYVEEQQLVGKPLLKLQARQCKWPVNDADKGEQHLFCGLAVARGPYCAHHVRRSVPQVRP